MNEFTNTYSELFTEHLERLTPEQLEELNKWRETQSIDANHDVR